MFWRDRRAQGGHRLGESELIKRRGIHVALHDQDLIGQPTFADLIEAIELTAFMKHGCFRRIHVFGPLIAQRPPTKRDDPPTPIMNREHHPIAEFVHWPVVFKRHQPSFFQGFDIKALRCEVVAQALPLIGRVTQPKFIDGGFIKTTPFEVFFSRFVAAQ